MELIFPMENVTKNRFQKSGINGLILGSATDAMLSTLEIDGEKFTFLERSMILAYRDQIKAEEAQNQRKLDEKEAQKKMLKQRKLMKKFNSRTVFYLVKSAMKATQITFTSDNDFKNFLKESGLISFANIDIEGKRSDIRDSALLVNGSEYFGVMKKTGSDHQFDPESEIKNMINAVRSKADYATKRYLDEHYNANLKFIGHDIKLFYESGGDAGDIDSLFETCDTCFLVERKRTVNESMFEQITRIREVYKASLKSQGITKNVVSILYSETLDEALAKRLLVEGVHVLQDSIESRFFNDPKYKRFLA